MKNKFRYLRAFLTLAFVVGQIQCAYATCFCTERQSPVSMPRVVMNSPDTSSGSTICDECHGVITMEHGMSLESPSCILFTLHTKSVVSSFTNLETFSGHFEPIMLFHFISRGTCRTTLASNHLLFATTDSPPLPLHLTNLNLRI